jgi:NhaP-type Na+/H+ or K+/H+ antiporter
MKNKAGIIIGFIAGVAGFLLLFKFLFLDKIPREDEVAPGLVVLAAVFNGLLFAFIGSMIQNYLDRKRHN